MHVSLQSILVPEGLVGIITLFLPLLWEEMRRTGRISEETLDLMGLPLMRRSCAGARSCSGAGERASSRTRRCATSES